MPIVTNDPYLSKIRAAWDAHAKDREQLPGKFRLPQGAAAADKSLENRMKTMQTARSGDMFRVPEQISASVKSSQKRMETMQNTRSGNAFQVQGPKSVVEIAAAANARMLKNRQEIYARLQGN